MNLHDVFILVLVGIAAGIIAGGLGVGGGIIIVPALIYIFGLTQHQAQGTSLAVLLFPVGILATLYYYKNGYVNFKFVFVLVIAFVLGSYLGSVIAVQLPARTLRKAFGVLMLIAGFKMLLEK